MPPCIEERRDDESDVSPGKIAAWGVAPKKNGGLRRRNEPDPDMKVLVCLCMRGLCMRALNGSTGELAGRRERSFIHISTEVLHN